MTEITLPRAVVEQALRWADQHGETVYSGGGWDAVDSMNEWAQALRDRLAQPEQEPVFDCPRCGHCCPQRKPLTDEQIDRLWSQSLADTEGETYLPLREFARAIYRH